MEAAPGRERQAFWFLVLLSLTHAVVDLSSGAVVALLPAIREHFQLNYTMVGNVMLFFSLTSSVTQPIFGIVSDRAQQRWLLPLSLLLGGLGLAAVGWMPNYWLVVGAVILCALGTAAFHPEGAHAALHLAGAKRARAMAIYSVGGNIGFALGPIYATILLSVGEAPKGTTWALLLPGLLAVWILRLLPRWQGLEAETSLARHVRREDLPGAQWLGFILITLLVILRSMINIGVVSYVPFYWIDVLGNDPATASYVQVMYMIAGVGGTLLGAPLADRFGTKRLLVASFALLMPLQLLIPFLQGIPLLICLFAAGFVVVMTFTITLVMTQEYMPRNPGLASGVNLGLAFGMGGVGTLLLGMVSDRWGVVAALQTVAALVPLTLLLAMALPPVQRAVQRSSMVSEGSGTSRGM